jgi:ParB family chromosome partitioning protein
MTNQTATDLIHPSQCRLAPGRADVPARTVDDLVASMREHGQINPAIVRLTPPGDTHPFELVTGARRHTAAILLAFESGFTTANFRIEIRDLTDEQAFAVADQENRTRRDITDHQRAVDYAAALALHYEGSQALMARRLKIHPAILSRYLTLAALPPIVFAAFGGPHLVTLTYTTQLAAYLKDAQLAERLLARAEQYAVWQTDPKKMCRDEMMPNRVMAALADAAKPAPHRATEIVWSDDGKLLASGYRRADGFFNLIAAFDPEKPAICAEAMIRVMTTLCVTGPSYNL